MLDSVLRQGVFRPELSLVVLVELALGLGLQAYHFLLLPINVTKQTLYVEDVELLNLCMATNIDMCNMYL